MQFVFEKENVFYKEKCNTTAIHDRCLANCFKEDSNNTTTLMSGKFTFDETLKCSGWYWRNHWNLSRKLPSTLYLWRGEELLQFDIYCVYVGIIKNGIY